MNLLSEFDLIIENGLVFNGLGTLPRKVDLGIRDGRIVAIESGLGRRWNAKKTINASGLWVTPGFIDIHTHYDLEAEISPGLSESVRHGVTTVVMGNCSLSIAIGKPQDIAHLFQRVETLPSVFIEKWLKKSMNWNSLEGYIQHFKDLPLGPNVSVLLGHSALRAHVMGLERSLKELANEEDLSRMRELATKALESGFSGISIDCVPWHMMHGEFRGRTIPSQHAGYHEYAMLADVARRKNAVFQVTPNPQNFFSIFILFWLAIGIFRKPLRMTMLSALDSVAYRQLWRLFPLGLFIFNRILRCNIRFQSLTEPFTVYSDGPLTPLFEEFGPGVELNNCDTTEERVQLWKDPAFKVRFRAEWLHGPRKTFHCDLQQMLITACPDRKLENKTIGELASLNQQQSIDLFIELLEKYDTDLRWVSTGANDRLEPRLKLLKHPDIFPGFTDAGAHVKNLGYYDGSISLLKQAVQTGFISIEKAIHRVTNEPAQWFGVNTGKIELGAKADINLIRPEGLNDALSDQVEFSDPVLDGLTRLVKRGSSQIIHSVYIAGEQVVQDGEPLPILGQQKLGEYLMPEFNPEFKEERINPSINAGVLECRDVVRTPPLCSHGSHPALKGEVSPRSMRNAITSEMIDHPFTDYWDLFVLKHQNKWNILFHCIGVVLFYGILAVSLSLWNFKLLLLLPSSQLVGLIGHHCFERSHIDGQDAVFSFRASRCLNKMFVWVLMGWYWPEVEKNQALLLNYINERKLVA